jgi:hypothetical protein
MLFAAAEAIALLIECAKIFNAGRATEGSLLLLIGAVGILLVDWFFTKAIDKYK